MTFGSNISNKLESVLQGDGSEKSINFGLCTQDQKSLDAGGVKCNSFVWIASWKGSTRRKRSEERMGWPGEEEAG
jgi:hypothetical protein